MYETTNNYKSKVYEASTRHLLKIFINNVEINKKYILDIKPSNELFSNGEFTLGSTPSQGIELKLYKSAVPEKIDKVYILSGIEGEEIPVGYFNLDDISKDDDFTITLKLKDNMIKFEFNYDGSQLLDGDGYAEIIEVTRDICNKAGVELRFYYFFKYA